MLWGDDAGLDSGEDKVESAQGDRTRRLMLRRNQLTDLN